LLRLSEWLALATALQLWLSDKQPANRLIAMLVHTLIGLGEALITVAALSFIFRTRPDLLGEGSASAEGGRGWVVAGAVISLIVVLLSPLASVNPDGLNRIAMDLGFIDSGRSVSGPLAGYTVPFLANASASKIVAGAIGALVVLALAFVAGRSLQKKTS
jgi:cobalt/nickel transport system permease protein